jgi:anti-sigma regulatory factor (Ser/Thr protein kinase)
VARLVLSLPPVPAVVTRARHRLREWLDEAGLDLDPSARDDLLVIVTELVTNGVLHDGGANIAVTADADRTGISLEVETIDGSRYARRRFRDEVDPAEDGRGLAIVGALADHVRTEISDARRRVTCHVPCAHR